MKYSGVYIITNIESNNYYIGSSYNMFNRISQHKSELKKKKHTNPILQKVYNKYGLENFKFEVLAKCPKEYLIKLEQWFIDKMKPEYNICKVAGRPNAPIITDEFRNKVSLRFKGKKQNKDVVKLRTGKRKIKVVSIDLKSNIVCYHDSQLEASLNTKISEPTIIKSIKTGKALERKNYIFMTLENYNKLKYLK